jgi:hypothetical protein
MKNDNMQNENNIKGWGIDADYKDHPAYPMRQEKPEEHFRKGIDWERPTLQRTSKEVLHSNERPSLAAVYGTPNPPKLLSGVLRRFAFRFSESDLRHWMTLLLADRIDMVEAIFEDIFSGHFPNFLAEMGIKSELKYNKAGFIKKVAITLIVVVLVVALLV